MVIKTDLEGSTRTGDRRAFSLVELLVAMALIVFIMSILSSAFTTASKTFSELKAAGDLAERLRGVMTLLRRDLAAPHFTTSGGSRSLILVSQVTQPQPGGFFRIYQGNTAPIQQGGPGGPDLPAYINTDAKLHFTVTLPGNMPADFFSTNVLTAGGALFDPNYLRTQGYPAPISLGYTTTQNQDNRYQASANPALGSSVLKSQFGEVAWWVSRSINPDGTNASTPAGTNFDGTAQTAQPLFTLRRRQLVIWPEGPAQVPWPPNPPNPPPALPQPTAYPSITMQSPNYDELSMPQVPAGVTVPINWMQQVANPALRFGMNVVNPPYVPPGTTTPPPYVLTTNGAVGRTYAGRFPGAARNNYPSPVAPPLTVPNSGRIDDIVIDNVLSFDVQVLIRGNTHFVHISDSQAVVPPNNTSVQAYSNNNLAFPANGGPWVYDTWSSQTLPNCKYDYSTWQNKGTYASIPLWRTPSNIPPQATDNQNISIQAIQVTLRLWDLKAQMTRQVSMVQAM